MEFNFDDLIDLLDGEEFEEKPVDLKTFVRSPEYLGLPELSDYQYTLIEKSSQIYVLKNQLSGEAYIWGSQISEFSVFENPGTIT